jgi:hypothetical protein
MRSPAPRYPTLRNVQDGRSPGFSDRELRELEEGERLVAHRSRQGRGGPACLAGKAASRTAAQGAVPGTVPDRPWPRPLRIES